MVAFSVLCSSCMSNKSVTPKTADLKTVVTSVKKPDGKTVTIYTTS